MFGISFFFRLTFEVSESDGYSVCDKEHYTCADYMPIDGNKSVFVIVGVVF